MLLSKMQLKEGLVVRVSATGCKGIYRLLLLLLSVYIKAITKLFSLLCLRLESLTPFKYGAAAAAVEWRERKRRES